eukprot:3730396-Pyramimonas_sp.AAC.2
MLGEEKRPVRKMSPVMRFTATAVPKSRPTPPPDVAHMTVPPKLTLSTGIGGVEPAGDHHRRIEGVRRVDGDPAADLRQVTQGGQPPHGGAQLVDLHDEHLPVVKLIHIANGAEVGGPGHVGVAKAVGGDRVRDVIGRHLTRQRPRGKVRLGDDHGLADHVVVAVEHEQVGVVAPNGNGGREPNGGVGALPVCDLRHPGP